MAVVHVLGGTPPGQQNSDGRGRAGARAAAAGAGPCEAGERATRLFEAENRFALDDLKRSRASERHRHC